MCDVTRPPVFDAVSWTKEEEEEEEEYLFCQNYRAERASSL